MSTYTYHLQRVLPPLSSLIGVLGLITGIYNLIDPQAGSEMLGIAVTTSISPAIPFVSFVGARNLGSGVTALVLLYTGQKKALGTVFMCGVTVAFADAWICAKYKATEGKVVGRAVMGVAFGLLGAGMYWIG